MSPGLIRALLITDPLIILATIILGSINLAVSFFDHGGRKQVAIARFWSKVLIKIAGVRRRSLPDHPARTPEGNVLRARHE